WRGYGIKRGGQTPREKNETPPGGLIMGESGGAARGRAAEGGGPTKQKPLHHGDYGRLSTRGELALPCSPPEGSVGAAYRFNVYHLMRAGDLEALFPLEIETL